VAGSGQCPAVGRREAIPTERQSRDNRHPAAAAQRGQMAVILNGVSMDIQEGFRDVAPVRPAAGYIGGKRRLARRIISVIESIPHGCYAEPFVGMGGVFLRRRLAPKLEVINDISGDVATFFRILQRHHNAFVDMLRWQLTGRREFERLKACDPATLTDLERAARFLYLQRTAFGGKVSGRNFGVSPGEGAAFNPLRLVPVIDDLHERLAGIVIEQLHYADFIRRYDRPGTLFYLDPPYAGSEDDYGKGVFTPADFLALAELLAGLQGRFVLSINDTPAIRQAFSRFALQPVDLTYSVGGGRRSTAAQELIVTDGKGGAGALKPPRRENQFDAI